MRTKIISFLICVIFTLSASAQEHLQFKGIPISGSITTFCQSLKNKGFTLISQENNITIFTGDFTGRQATVCVYATDNRKNVHSVGVFFEPSGEWNTLVNAYEYYKKLYTHKYGKPSFNKENNPSYSNENTSLMLKVAQGTVVWGSSWEVTGGTIDLSIEKSTGFCEGMVVIQYRDSQNIEEKIKNDLDEI